MVETRRYAVTGMSCSHCESAVREEVEQLTGVASLEVSASTGLLELTVTEPALADAQVLAAVDEAGYDATRQP
ncbi:heavy-metal-associated domain-containing protein [Nesterenkonia lutea]|uniref:Copper chaperone CopZ n=1 Tax=Nesterenkonia lutea TaxID=272919 RepID=A0ABR9JG95_9MICC|nr:heavy-metal-associated domain-containing protein [Nesterenkonia lutea]MBE1524820.1 copper chaperone CopZ [Nesterenkonia lutea]